MRKTGVLFALVALYLALTAPTADAQKRRRLRPEPAPSAQKLADLVSADPAVAAAAATSLGGSRSPAATAALIDALAMGVTPQLAVAVLTALAQQRNPRAADIVAVYSRHRDPAVRAAAIAAAGAMLHAGSSREIVLAALHDGESSVRAAAADVARASKLTDAVEPLLALLRRGDDAAGQALAALADVELARIIGEQIGSAPDAVLARCLGALLLRADFGPEDARVQVVGALGKVPGAETLEQLSNYVAAVPETSARESRRQAEVVIEQRVGGGN